MRKVITYGTFDLFHKGHYNILKRAKESGDYLIVGVTGESYDAERGKLSVQDSLATRIENVKKTGFANQIIVEEYLGQKISDILKYDIDVLVIGSDWKGKFDHLTKYCEVKYLERTKNISSTQIREEKLDIYKFGIVTDNEYDDGAVAEPKNVSGIHVESVFSDNEATARKFAEKYELDCGYTDYDKFLDSVDIVYIKTKTGDRYKYAERAIMSGKHVICDSPITLDLVEGKNIKLLAEEKDVVLLNNITTLYLQAFGQLLWMARGNLIGDLVRVKCSISNSRFSSEIVADFTELMYWSLCAIMKILGSDYDDFSYKIVRNEEGDISYCVLNINYNNAVAAIEIGNDLDVGGSMSILGSKGSIYVPDNWWNIGYFEVTNSDETNVKRYSSNLEGNGFRYLIQAMLKIINNKAFTNQRVTYDEDKSILTIIGEVNKIETD